jgi:carbonic anhydrase/acetyltransferase-like protein (isoleucine patch superfamily)
VSKISVVISAGLITMALCWSTLIGYSTDTAKTIQENDNPLEPNVKTSFNESIETPTIGHDTFVHPKAAVIGHVILGDEIFVAPFASIRGDEGQPIFIGSKSNVQDGVIIHALKTHEEGVAIPKHQVNINQHPYGVYIGERVSLAHQAQVHGPAFVGNDVFIGMQALVFKARIANHVVIEPGAKLIGVDIAEGRYVPAGMVVTEQKVADKLPVIDDDYPYAHLNEEVVGVNVELAKGYRKPPKK